MELTYVSIDGWIKKMQYRYTKEYYSATKEWNSVICSNMELEDIMLSEVSQAQKDNYHIFSLTCGS
jgi:hypothetical protein